MWLHDADGDVFEGDFKDDKMEGKSTNTRTLTGACTR